MKFKEITWLALCFLAILSCEKETVTVVEEVEKEFNWKQDDNFLFNAKTQLNGFATDDQLFLIGPNFFTKISSGPEDTSQHSSLSYFLPFPYPIQNKLSISKELYMGYINANIGFFTTNSPVSYSSDNFRDMRDYDADFSNFDVPIYSRGISFPINSLNQCLITYQRFITVDDTVQVVEFEPYLAMAEIELFEPESRFINDITIKEVTKKFSMGKVLAQHLIEDYFFVTGTEKTIRVNPDLTINDVSQERLLRIFEYQGSLYGFTREELYRSTDTGLSWQTLGGIQSDFFLLNYTQIDGQLIAFYKSQIFKLDITDNGIDSEELDNDGLFGHEITSINTLTNKVYITTLSGVFVRDLADFFEAK
ncbi:MAG: hypothetical protein AAFO07_06335 [Bacteroidota bacterium]